MRKRLTRDLDDVGAIGRERCLEQKVESAATKAKRDRHGEDVPLLLPEVLEALEAHRATFNEAQRKSGLLFPSRDGRHHSRTVLAKPLVDICQHAGITKRFTPHGCRRTGAKLYGRTSGTRMAMSIAGHMTEAMHAHYAPVDASEKLAAGNRAFLRIRKGGQACGRRRKRDPNRDPYLARPEPPSPLV